MASGGLRRCARGRVSSASRFLEKSLESAGVGSGIGTYGYASSRLAVSTYFAADAEEARMHIGSAILIIWLIIGGFAAGQRGDYKGAFDCTGAATTAMTILAGPLNYTGVNPHINCSTPRPSN
jgi:hypothetical protein